MANAVISSMDKLSDYLKQIKVPGTDVNVGDATIGFFTTVGGTSLISKGLAAIPALAGVATSPVGGAISLIGAAYLAKEVAQAAGVDIAIKKPNEYMIASAVLALLAAVFLPQALFAIAPAGAAQALQSVITLVK